MPQHPGVTVRNSSKGEKSYRAEAWDNDAKRRVYKTFPTLSAAKKWRAAMQTKIANGEARAVEPTTVKEAWLLWLEKADKGVIRARGGQVYKPGVIRSYRLSFEGRLLARFGNVKVGDLQRVAVQHYVDDLVEEGLAPQTVKNTINALRVLMKWIVRQNIRHDNPCTGLELPAGGVERNRVAPVTEAVELLGAIKSDVDRAIFALAFFAGLRRGELMALAWDCVDLLGLRIEVHPTRGNYDPHTGSFGPPKSKAGARKVGIPDLLVPYLAALNTTEGLVAPRADGRPFSDSSLMQRVRANWAEAGLEGIGLHESRHTYASLMIAAGVNIKTISVWMGHSSVNITIDLYGHMLPGSEQEALGLLNGYLGRELAA